MTLSENGKAYIAQHFGKLNSSTGKYCFVTSGVSYTDPLGVSQTGGTFDVVSTLCLSGIESLARGPAGEKYEDLNTANGSAVNTSSDPTWVGNNDGDPPSETVYCVSPTTTSPPASTIAPSGPGVFKFLEIGSGQPTVTLDLFDLTMKQADDFHFEMNGVRLTNTSQYREYIVYEVKLYSGVRTTCPTSGEVFSGLDRTYSRRFQTDPSTIRVKVLDPGDVDVSNLDFYQPTLVGSHTVCLIVHSGWTLDQIQQEVASIRG